MPLKALGALRVLDDTRQFTVNPLAPVVEERYPPNDDWTEPDYTTWGKWETGTTAEIQLDPTQKVVREHSVYTESDGVYARAVFTLNDGLEVNTDNFPRYNFAVAVVGGTQIDIYLEDSAGMVVSRREVIKEEAWNALTLLVGSVNAALWTPSVFNTLPFDWTKVKKLVFVFGAGYALLWIDAIYFTYKIEGYRALDVTVVDKETGLPVQGASVVYGFLVGVDPNTNEETYFWMDGEKGVTGTDGKVVFSELDPDWHGLRVTAEGFKEAIIKDIDLRATDKAITVELERVTWEDWLPLIVGGVIVVTAFTVIVSRL